MLAAHLPFVLGTIIARTTVPWCIGVVPAHSRPLQGPLDHGSHRLVMAGMDQDLGFHPLDLEHPLLSKNGYSNTLRPIYYS